MLLESWGEDQRDVVPYSVQPQSGSGPCIWGQRRLHVFLSLMAGAVPPANLSIQALETAARLVYPFHV